MELKLEMVLIDRRVGESLNRTRVELKHAFSSDEVSMDGGLNRTRVELKHGLTQAEGDGLDGLNRTRVELKQFR